MRLTEEILKELILTEMSRDEMLQKMGETWVQLAFDDDASFVIQAGELLLMSEDDLEPKQFETLKGLVSDQLYNLGRIDAVVELLLDGMDAEVLPLESADKERDYYLETIMVRGGDLKKIYSEICKKLLIINQVVIVGMAQNGYGIFFKVMSTKRIFCTTLIQTYILVMFGNG